MRPGNCAFLFLSGVLFSARRISDVRHQAKRATGSVHWRESESWMKKRPSGPGSVTGSEGRGKRMGRRPFSLSVGLFRAPFGQACRGTQNVVAWAPGCAKFFVAAFEAENLPVAPGQKALADPGHKGGMGLLCRAEDGKFPGSRVQKDIGSRGQIHDKKARSKGVEGLAGRFRS